MMCDEKGAPPGYSATIAFSHVTNGGGLVFMTCNNGMKKEIVMTEKEVTTEINRLQSEIDAETMAMPFSTKPYDVAVLRCGLRHLSR